MTSIAVMSFVVGLLPLQNRRSAHTCKRAGLTLIADPRWGMPDGRDVLALLLCSDAVARGLAQVKPCGPVTHESLMRVAGLRIERETDGRKEMISVAHAWDSSAIVLSTEFANLVSRHSQRGSLSWRQLLRLTPGAVGLAMALTTSPTNSACLDHLAEQVGSRAVHRSSVRQQLRGWLAELQAAGIRRWAYDRMRNVVFQVAEVIRWVGQGAPQQGWQPSRVVAGIGDCDPYPAIEPTCAVRDDRGNSS